jgi:hypothetical protein
MQRTPDGRQSTSPRGVRVQDVAEALVARGGAFLACRIHGRADVPTGPLLVLAGAVLPPPTPGFCPVVDPTGEPLPARLRGTRERRSPGREGTCRSPT